MNKAKSPHLHYVRNDLTNNKSVDIVLGVMLVLSAFLMATGALVAERVVGSVDQLFDEAKPPHFLQMHVGDYDLDALTQFAAAQPDIESWHVVEMLGFDSAAIAWGRPSTGESGDLSASFTENLFVTQQAEFDFLLDEFGAVAQPSRGEVYVPVAYQQQFDLRAGDTLSVATDEGHHGLRIEGFVRDAQMASSLSAATRFLVAEEDLADLARAGGGAPEIIVEYRLSDPALANDFQRAYEADGALPGNGEAVTYQMVRLINAFSDGLVAVTLMFMSLILVAIALLNLRFVIRGTLEDEVREIGAMKAIGIPDKAIARLYLAKYRVMTVLACVIGGLMAVTAANWLTRDIQVNYAEAASGPAAVVVGVLALTLVYVFVIAVCRGVFRAIRKIQVVNALVHGSTLDERQTARRATRQARRVRRTSLVSGPGSINQRLALLDLRAERRQWALIPVVFCLAAIVMTLPMNLHSTFTNPGFVAYMGVPESDLRIDVPNSQDVDAVRSDILASLAADQRVTDTRVFARVLYEAQSGDEHLNTLRVDVGDYSGGAVAFTDGGHPGPGEIALSVLNADKYQVSTGDELKIYDAGEPAMLTVSGLYQDVTSSGLTAKVAGEITAGANSYVIYANTADSVDIPAIASEYNEQFPDATTYPMRDYIQQMLSYLTNALSSAAILSGVFGVAVAALITGLFLKLRLARDRRKMGVMSAVGFSAGEIIGQTRGKTLLTAGVGTFAGILIAATAGESMVGAFIALANLGISDLEFMPNPLLVYAVLPLLLITAGYLGAVTLTAGLRKTDKSLWLGR